MRLFRTLYRASNRTLYRALQAQFVGPMVLPFFLPSFKIEERVQTLGSYPKKAGQKKAGEKRVWFHAASVGELESLWPVILLTAQDKFEIIVTIFSSSAAGTIKKLRKALEQEVGSKKIVYMGYSPWEGYWKESFQNLSPDLFVSAKYEAWPDLWVSLRELSIPLVIVSARARRSLKLARCISQGMIDGLPELVLLPATEDEEGALQEIFPTAKVIATGEPRWDRVFERTQKGNARAQELLEKYSHFPRPWGVIGSAWLEDLALFKPHLQQIKGTLWVVPHQVDASSIEKMNALLKSFNLTPKVTSTGDVQKIGDRVPFESILVDEMGILTELYSKADWAFVGGGFGAGVHSTIEPAIFGIPIACGPKGANRFSEISQLIKTGQLTIIDNLKCGKAGHLKAYDILDQWLNRLDEFKTKQDAWKKQARERRGASQRVFHFLNETTS